MNVTYLLGAGASAHCLPIYSNFKRRFEKFILKIQHNNSHDPAGKEIIAIGKELIKEFDFHNTPDTIAKKYFHQGRTDLLDNLKKVVILFFIYEQTLETQYGTVRTDRVIKSQIDKRYDSFLAGILQPTTGLFISGQFSILTWNYDIQFEVSYANYSGEKFLEVQNRVQSIPLLNQAYSAPFNQKNFSIIHLNGIAYPNEKLEDDLTGTFHAWNSYPTKRLLHWYEYMSNAPDVALNNFKFAWENYKNGNLSEDYAPFRNSIKVAKKTHVLVIVGYSFPIFNRLIDKQVLGNMKDLRKVYVQTDQFNKIGSILENDLLKSKINTEIIDVGFTDQFFIPPEWDSTK